jgi:hypothetical protein
VGLVSAIRAAEALVDDGPLRRSVAVELARGVVADRRAAPGEVAAAADVLRRAGLVEEAAVARALAVARGVEPPAEPTSASSRLRARLRGPFSRAA